MGLKSNKLRPFWLSLKNDERQRYEEVKLTYFLVLNEFIVSRNIIAK